MESRRAVATWSRAAGCLLRSRTPGLRAVVAVGIALPLFLTIFATAYALLSQREPGSFSEPLDRVLALYFSIVVFGTVGWATSLR